MEKIKTLIVDDSAAVRTVIKSLLEKTHDIEVMAAVENPIFAMRRMESCWPDVIVLDIEMPRMDGLTFLQKLMKERPTPVVMCSTLTGKGSVSALKAMSLGAVEVVHKPRAGVVAAITGKADELISAIRAASCANMRAMGRNIAIVSPSRRFTADAILPKSRGPLKDSTADKIVAIGTSTGGTQALEAILTRLSPNVPGIVIVQHMPENFTRAFADRLNSICKITVKEAADRDRVIPGRALVAPGGRHLLVKSSGSQAFVEIKDGPPVSRHRPSVDVLFRSVAKSAGRNSLGIIMTGMGDDGAAGLKEMRDNGARTLGQNEASCVVYGMPAAAMKKEAVDKEVDLCNLSAEIEGFGRA